MTISIHAGDRVGQHPRDTVAYSTAAAIVKIRRMYPSGDGVELLVQAIGDGIALISGGLNGARYELTLENETRWLLDFSSRGFFRSVQRPTAKRERRGDGTLQPLEEKADEIDVVPFDIGTVVIYNETGTAIRSIHDPSPAAQVRESSPRARPLRGA